MQNEYVVILGISVKKDLGWVRLSTVGQCWQELGSHFEKTPENLEQITEPGLYKVQIQNMAKFGENPKYLIKKAIRVKTFQEMLA